MTQLTQALGPPRQKIGTVRRAVRAALALCRRQCRPYRGGLPAERQSVRRIVADARRAVRIAVLSHRGRLIELPALLALMRPDGFPVWALVNPLKEIHDYGFGNMNSSNGLVYCWRTRTLRAVGADRSIVDPGPRPPNEALPSAMPPLPHRVRALLTPATIRRASMIGVLYQPAEWSQQKPDAARDPALVVEWRDRPGEYRALAVWGLDRCRIMEFVH